jgi:hypothetical protein
MSEARSLLSTSLSQYQKRASSLLRVSGVVRFCNFQDVFSQPAKLIHIVQTRSMNMKSQKLPQKALEDIRLNVKLKIAAIWAGFMFLYIYVDYFSLYKPGFIEDVIAGKVWQFKITQDFLLGALVSVSIPALMIFLSVALPPKVNRWTNIIMAAVYIPFSLFNLAGEAWNYMIFGAVVEVILLLLVIWYAWKWPKRKA